MTVMVLAIGVLVARVVSIVIGSLLSVKALFE